MDSATKACQDELDVVCDSVTNTNHRLERLYDALETGKVNLDELVPRIRELQSRQEQLQTRKIEIETQMSDRKVELADLETISCYVEDLHDLLKEGSLTERRAFIRSSVKEVKVIGDEAVLSYSIPLLPEKMAVEKEGVLPTVHYGGRYKT